MDIQNAFGSILLLAILTAAAGAGGQTSGDAPAKNTNAQAAASHAGGPVRVALTFDDLPAHGPLPPGETRLEVISKIIAALRDAHVPPVYGFVNGALLEQQPDNAAVLTAWQEAGNLFGNHTWSHLNLNQHSLEEFEADATLNEGVLNKFSKGSDWHWFRFPFLAEGDTDEKRAGIRKFLQQRGYRVAGVTMGFGDYMWNDPYVRCRAKNDKQALELLETSYLEAADEGIAHSQELSRRAVDREIPFVLLIHVGAFDAEMLPQMLERFRARGVEFITLEQAESDDFYKLDTHLDLPPGPDTLESLIATRQANLPPQTSSLPQFDEMCR